MQDVEPWTKTNPTVSRTVMYALQVWLDIGIPLSVKADRALWALSRRYFDVALRIGNIAAEIVNSPDAVDPSP